MTSTENTDQSDRDQGVIIYSEKSPDLFTGGQPECDNGKQSQHREPTLVRQADPDL